MLVKGDPGLLNAHILMKFRCNIYLSIQNMCSFNSFQNISIPFTILSNVFISYWLIYIVIKVKYKKMLWTHSIYFRDFKTPQFLHTCANLLALRSVKWFSFSDSLFSSYGVVGSSTTLLKWPFIPLWTVSVPAHFESFSYEV